MLCCLIGKWEQSNINNKCYCSVWIGFKMIGLCYWYSYTMIMEIWRYLIDVILVFIVLVCLFKIYNLHISSRPWIFYWTGWGNLKNTYKTLKKFSGPLRDIIGVPKQSKVEEKNRLCVYYLFNPLLCLSWTVIDILYKQFIIFIVHKVSL